MAKSCTYEEASNFQGGNSWKTSAKTQIRIKLGASKLQTKNFVLKVTTNINCGA